jgi:hypothetical protein
MIIKGADELRKRERKVGRKIKIKTKRKKQEMN